MVIRSYLLKAKTKIQHIQAAKNVWNFRVHSVTEAMKNPLEQKTNANRCKEYTLESARQVQEPCGWCLREVRFQPVPVRSQRKYTKQYDKAQRGYGKEDKLKSNSQPKQHRLQKGWLSKRPHTLLSTEAPARARFT